MKWSFANIWNESLEKRTERPLVVRNNIWASELGGSYVDRYLKMKAAPPSNPHNPRSLRKFEAGNLTEWIVGMVLKRAGILIENQKWLAFKYPGLLEVTGKLDFLAGGHPNWEQSLSVIESLDLPEFFHRGAKALVEQLKEKHPNGLDQAVLEIKSCSSFMFDSYEFNGPNKNHSLQSLHYLKALNLPEAHIVYISKDDLRMLEFCVYNPSDLENEYHKDVEAITGYVESNTQPPIEDLILFDLEQGKFSLNWKVGYSPYLTKLYGFENQFSFDARFKKEVSQWNRVFARCVNGSNMTKLNLSVITEVKKSFPNFDALVDKVRETKGSVEELEEVLKGDE